MHFYKFISLGSLILSSLGFTTGVVLIRGFSSSESLSYIINLQSIVVFTSFLLQLGLRAALRGHLYNGRERLVKAAYESLYVFLLAIACLGVVFEILLDEFLYISLSCLLAIVTLKLTLAVARGETSEIITFSVLNFIVSSGSAFVLITIQDLTIIDKAIELISLLVLILLYRKMELKKVLRLRLYLLKVYWKAQSFQLGSCVIALFIFLLNQSAVAQLDGEHLNAYSDALILSGFLVLLIGKVLLLLERKFFHSGEKLYFLYVLLVVGQSVISAIVSYILSVLYQMSWGIIFTILFVLLSRTTAGYLVQFTKKKRSTLNFVSGALFLSYVSLYLIGFKDLSIGYQLIPVLLYLSLGFLFLRRKPNV